MGKKEDDNAGEAFVYLLMHVAGEDAEGDSKTIGIYRSEFAARAAVERLSSKPGFSRYPNGWSIDPYKLDEDNWCEGFEQVGGCDLPAWINHMEKDK